MDQEVDLVHNPGYDVDHAPGEVAETNPFDRYTAEWLSRRKSPLTREAYRRDVHEYLAWCAGTRRHPLDATFATIEDYRTALETTANSWTGKPPSPTTVARKVSAVSSWYKDMRKHGRIAINPAADAERPSFDKDHTNAVAFTATEATRLIAAATADRSFGEHGARALLTFLVELGVRVTDVCLLDAEDFGHDSGHRTVTLRHMKGGKTRTRPVPPSLGTALDLWLDERGSPTTGPVFVREGQRVTRQYVARFVRRMARVAQLPAAERISPHSFRHAWNTIAREKGATLEERQYALGHADPRTTQRYDHARESLDRDPAYLVAGAVA